jgi:FlaA1/EpsC-like NDP-sugar epimerase
MRTSSRKGAFDLLSQRVRNRHLLLSDFLLLPIAAVLAFALRLDSTALAKYYIPAMIAYALCAPLIKIPIFAALRLYSRFWRYASADELLLLAGAATLAALTQGAIFFVIPVLFPSLLNPGIPRSIPLLDILLTLVVIAAPRFALLLWSQNSKRSARASTAPHVQQRVLIAGAGEAGALILRELYANPQTGLIPIGFVDDNPQTHGMLIQRVRVLGGREKIPALVREQQIDQVIIAMPTAPGSAVRGIVDICEQAGIHARIIPGMYELLSGKASIGQLRDVQIEDLLRREPVHTDTEQVAALIRGRRVLVTGAGGSIGSELCRQILRCEPAELIILGHGENSIFEIANELQSLETRSWQSKSGKALPKFPASMITPVIADIRDADRLATVFAAHRSEIVFHTAAHKHVPLMEENVEDAVTNNVLGTRRLVEASIDAGVAHFVLISTDKAVNPSSVMGATKRVAELIVQEAAQRTGRAFVAVRFGNVLGSRGSVVPFFQRQIAAGGPITVTHPDIKRYFMTIPEAVQLVLQAAALGCGGEIFVLDMGEPVRIADLARDLIRLSGLEPDRDIEVRYTELRPGEKLVEELFGADETCGRTRHEKIFIYQNGHARRSNKTSADFRPVVPAASPLAAQIDALVRAAQRGDTAEVRRYLDELTRPSQPIRSV